jgi:hypothetical protein
MTNVTGKFTDISGAPIANGKVTFTLNDYATVGSSFITLQEVSTTLDDEGNLSVNIYGVDVLIPAGLYYTCEVFTAAGQLAWQGIVKPVGTVFNMSTVIP